MFNPENRYKEYSNSKKRNFKEVCELLNNVDDLLDFFFANVDEFNAIQAIDKANDIDEFKKDNYKNTVNALSIVHGLSKLNNPDESVTIYRGVYLGPDDVEPDLNLPGMCWTDSELSAEEFIVEDDSFADDPDYAECILTADYKAADIDWLYSVALMLDEPEEKEIRIYKDAKPISIDYNVL